ncbi:hypothetical protein LIER_40073 [Lithospermum erythrorhizon]|uniref:DUF4216 domain-containing protein n=1 Tax=Lithospermum erythrorhizon TaxID=34254 RepID=A0AAV3QQ43_LITER
MSLGTLLNDNGVENINGVEIDELRFLKVDLSRVGYKDDSFVLAAQAEQAFYVNDPVSSKWSITRLSNKNNEHLINVEEDFDVENDPFRGVRSTTNVKEKYFYVRYDHNESICTPHRRGRRRTITKVGSKRK